MIQDVVKQNIAAIIQSIPFTGRVYDHVKYSSGWQDFANTFLYQDPLSGYKQVRGWWIALPTLTENQVGSSFDSHWHNFIYPIHGVMSYSDKGNTDQEFSNMIWSVQQTLHGQGVLGIGPLNPVDDGSHVIDGSVELEVITVDYRMYGSVLCHHTEMRMTVGINQPTVWLP